ncbi:thiamine pyrophosphate-dependent enzyme, partial [Rhizobium ruizarguesonis]
VDEFPDFGMTFGNPDFVKYDESYGAKGTRVDDIGQFKQVLEEEFAGGGVHLVNVPVEYSENERVLVKELRERLHQILEV